MKDKLLRLRDTVYERLQKAVEYTGSNESELIRRGLENLLSELEEEMKQKEKVREERRTRRLLSRPPSSGLGLKKQLSSPTEAVAPPQPQIVVVQPQAAVSPLPPASAGTSASEISRLAAWVAAGANDYFEETRRTQTAVDVIKASTTDAAERERLADALDREVAQKKREARPEDSSPLSWIRRVVTGS